MKKTLILPENISEITLGQYQRFDKLTKRDDLSDLSYNKRVIEIFTDLKYTEVSKIYQKDYKEIIEQITKAMVQDAKFENTFKIDDVEFGMIPNYDKMSVGEFVDLNEAGLEIENYHIIMAILFRPITSKDKFNNYTIESYNGTEYYQEFMKRTPMNFVKGVFIFFYHLADELQNHILKSTKAEGMNHKQKNTLKNGDGTQRSVV